MMGYQKMSLLEASEVTVRFALRRATPFDKKQYVTAVNSVSFSLAPGETLSLVGESGCGKTTLGRSVLRMTQIAKGKIVFKKRDITHLSDRELRPLRREMQMIFQNPYASLDPSMLINESLEEPLKIHGRTRRGELQEITRKSLEEVGLRSEFLNRYPHELSGGQRQRVALARAIGLKPDFIVADEALSALDVSTQSQIAVLLKDIQQKYGIAYLFVSHDLTMVRLISDRVAVMYLGRIVEEGPAERVASLPSHPYSAALQQAVFKPDGIRTQKPPMISGEVPSPINPPKGCSFHPRCPFAMPICSVEQPAMTPVDGGGSVACHLQTEGPKLNGAPLPQ